MSLTAAFDQDESDSLSRCRNRSAPHCCCCCRHRCCCCCCRCKDFCSHTHVQPNSTESFPLTPQLTHTLPKLKAQLPSSVYFELVTLANTPPPSLSHTPSLSAGCLYSRPHWVIDSRGGIIEPREEREGGDALRSSNSKQKRESNICKVTQADVTPVHTARPVHTHTHTRIHILTCWRPCWKPLTVDSIQMKT